MPIKSPISSPLGQAEKEPVAGVLQSTLVDLIDLSLIAKQAHWNVVGKNFRSVHLQLDELVTLARTYTDEVAERASALGISPNGKVRTVAEGSVLDFPEGWSPRSPSSSSGSARGSRRPTSRTWSPRTC